jgi:hypothetical protein
MILILPGVRTSGAAKVFGPSLNHQALKTPMFASGSRQFPDVRVTSSLHLLLWGASFCLSAQAWSTPADRGGVY